MSVETPQASPKVSIIIPIYNAGRWLAQCLDSVCGQTLRDIEIVLVNDGSTDGSAGIIQRYAEGDKRINVIHQDNGGGAIARNVGMAVATGEYFGFVDADDYIDLDFFEKLYIRAKETGADLVKAEMKCVDFDGKVALYGPSFDSIRENRGNLDQTFTTCLYKRTFLKENDIVYPSKMIVADDSYFLLRATLLANKIEFVEGTYYHYVRHDGSQDSRFLSDDKVKANVTFSIASVDLINSMPLDEKTYLLVFSSRVRFLLQDVFYRNLSLEMRVLIVRTVMDLFTKCKHLDACAKYNVHYPYHCAKHDGNGLLLHLLKNCPIANPVRRVKVLGFIPLLKCENTKKGKARYRLLNVIPLMTIRDRFDTKTYCLFGFIPLWKVSHTFGKTSYKLLGFIPIATVTAEQI